MALKPEDKQLVAQLAISGEIVLRQRGWNKEQRDAFLSRKDVQKELADLDNVYKDREQIAERARFFGMVEMQRMVPRAVQLLQRALLAGQEVNGQIVEAPDEAQLEAAMQVLDRTGVHAKGGAKDLHGDGLAKVTGPVTINNINVNDGIAEASSKTLLREKLRTRIAQMLHTQIKEVSGNIVEGRVISAKKKHGPRDPARLPAPPTDEADAS
jgi:ribosomal protein S24E